jgi:hypothetical protein
MGLDVYSASKLAYSKDKPESKDLYEKFQDMSYLYERFEQQGQVVRCSPPYRWTLVVRRQGDQVDEWYDTHCADMREGYYQETEASERYEFRAGSYDTYNDWRNDLSLMVLGVTAEAVWRSPDAYALRPVYYLINFSYSDGVIGPTVCKLLASQFAEFQQRAEESDALDLGLYSQFRQAVELAADGGLVLFT